MKTTVQVSNYIRFILKIKWGTFGSEEEKNQVVQNAFCQMLVATTARRIGDRPSALMAPVEQLRFLSGCGPIA
ncbi:hypothetical protein KIN20_037151 [Parelaphostrongylus tenuis]|uniref:Uncharacterized protein n=1 Tax=Parelaphostrongylus tenuis TaxID=148309 RepID=A0AAD5RDW9_PARTN|nr:hypothetical protein KIN20_037151 [Parelaphostrongylus tenuis]